MTLEEMKNIDVKTVDPETLVDITQISIDENLQKEERIKEYIRQVKNPYCYKVGDIVVKTRYSDDSGLSSHVFFIMNLSLFTHSLMEMDERVECGIH